MTLPYFEPMTNKQLLVSLIKDRMVVKADAVTTSAGEQTTTYLDIQHVLEDERGLNLAADVLIEHLKEHQLIGQKDGGWADVVVGPMTGSIPLVVGLAMNSGYGMQWAVIRDEVKDHGLGRGFVGAQPGRDDKVILVDDVVSSGRSLANAAFQMQQIGAEVIAVVPLVDRGTRGAKQFEQDVFKNILYLPVLTYNDLEIEAL